MKYVLGWGLLSLGLLGLVLPLLPGVVLLGLGLSLLRGGWPPEHG